MNDRSHSRRLASSTLIWLVLMVAGSIGWIVLLMHGQSPERAWRALLISFIYFTPLSAGLVTWSAIALASNGTWPGKSERLSWTGIGFFIPSILLLIVLWIGSPQWAPWYGKDLPQGVWLNNTFLFVRELVALLVFWGIFIWFLRSRQLGRKTAMLPAGILIVAYAIVFSMFGFDFGLALDYTWYSTVFGAYFFISGLYISICCWTLLVTLRPDFGPDLRHDLGKLILAFGILTTYFVFIQLITIWYENLPDEVSGVVSRINSPDWRLVSIGVFAIVYLGPLVLLLTIWSKRNRIFLGAVSVLLLIGLWFERWWLVTPSFSEVQLGWEEFAAAAATLGALGLGIETARRHLPQVPAQRGDEQ